LEDQLNFEKALISAIVERKDMRKVLKQKIDASFFEDSLSRSVWSWLVKYFKDPKKTDTPSVAAFRAQFPMYELVSCEDSTEAICEEVRKAKLHSDIAASIQDISQKTMVDPLEGMKSLREHVSRLTSAHVISEAIDIRNKVPDLLEEYERMKALKGDQKLKGRPYPWPAANLATMGIQDGHLIWYYGRPKSKKTWTLLYTIENSHSAGAIPLLCSQELPDIEMARRYVAMKAKVDYGKMIRGELDPATENRFKLKLEEFVECPPVIITSLTSIGDEAPEELSGLIEEYGATIVGVDAANCLGNDVKEIVAMTRGFKRVAKFRNVPIIGTTQRLRQKGKKAQEYAGNGDDVYGSDSYLQDCDTLWLVESDLEMRRAGELKITSVAMRDGKMVSFVINSYLCTNFEQKRIVPFDDEDDDAAQTMEALDGQDDMRAEDEEQEEAVPAEEKPKETVTFGKPKLAKPILKKNQVFVPAQVTSSEEEFEEDLLGASTEELPKPVKKVFFAKR
jgi:replicative DNA helicase